MTIKWFDHAVLTMKIKEQRMWSLLINFNSQTICRVKGAALCTTRTNGVLHVTMPTACSIWHMQILPFLNRAVRMEQGLSRCSGRENMGGGGGYWVLMVKAKLKSQEGCLVEEKETQTRHAVAAVSQTASLGWGQPLLNRHNGQQNGVPLFHYV